MKKTLFLIPLTILSIVGCSNDNTNNNEITFPTKHEIVLTLSNYKTYFDITSTTNYNQTTYDFKGCLSYAFYDGVVITIEYYNAGVSTSETNSESEDVILNAGGNGHFAGGGKYYGTINSITGKVIYWM